MVLEWTSVSEKDTRGFLLGYILHYTESPDDRTDAETSKIDSFDVHKKVAIETCSE